MGRIFWGLVILLCHEGYRTVIGFLCNYFSHTNGDISSKNASRFGRGQVFIRFPTADGAEFVALDEHLGGVRA